MTLSNWGSKQAAWFLAIGGRLSTPDSLRSSYLLAPVRPMRRWVAKSVPVWE